MKMVLSSDNAGKLREFRDIFADTGIELLSKKDCGCSIEVEETGTSYQENAYLKAVAVTEATGEIAVADDSGLMVAALDGAPGVHSARFTGSHEDTDEQRYLYLLEKLDGVADRRAKFVSCICCTFPNGDVLRARGECHGEIALEMSGTGGFGYDPVFLPKDCGGASMASISQEKKNEIAHRGRAIRAFKEELKKYYADK